MSIAKRLAALAVAAVMLFCLAACKGGSPQGDKEGTETALPSDNALAAELTAAQQERAKLLAAAFMRFGEYDITEGVTISRIEEMINCMYCTILDESEVEGFGRVTIEEADDMLRSVFGSDTLELVLRTKYDASEEQDYYSMNDYYYVRRIAEVYDYEITSVSPIADEDGAVIGVKVMVDAKSNGIDNVTIALDLADNSEGELCVKRCELFNWS